MKRTTKNVRSNLVRLMKAAVFLRLSRSVEPGYFRGYALSVGDELCMMAVLQQDVVTWNGYSILRISDIEEVSRDPYAKFAENALGKLGVAKPKKPSVNIENLETALREVSRLFPLVTIHHETEDPDVCWIGSVQDCCDGELSLLEIGPDAKWDRRPTVHKIATITRVDFGGSYEQALYLVGGRPRMR